MCNCLFQLLIHVESGTATISHSEDNRGSTTHNVTSSIDGGAGTPHLLVDNDGVLASQFQTLDRLRNEWVGTYAYGNDDLVNGNLHSLAFYRHR